MMKDLCKLGGGDPARADKPPVAHVIYYINIEIREMKGDL